MFKLILSCLVSFRIKTEQRSYEWLTFCMQGQLGVPNKLFDGIDIITPETGSKEVRFPVLNLPNIFRNKLAAFQNRYSRKDFEDILWLVGRYKDDIPAIREQLDVSSREYWLAAFAYHSLVLGKGHLVEEYGRVLGVLKF
jgi:hypothetical protein